MPASPKLLLVDSDPLLMPLRRQRLVQAGFQVTSVSYPGHAQRLFASERFDAVILAHTLPASERELLAENLRKLQPKIPMLLLYAGGDTSGHWADFRADGLAPPEALVRSVRQFLQQSAATRSRAG